MRLALWSFLILTACSLAPRRPPALHDFGPPPAETHSRTQVVVTAPTWLQDRRLRYRFLFADPTQVRFYADHRWIAHPPALLQQRLSALLNSPYRLRVELHNLEQAFDTPNRSRVVLCLFAEATASEGQSLGARFFALEKPTASADVHGALSGYAELIEHAAASLRAWLESIHAESQAPARTRATNSETGIGRAKK